MVTLEYFRFPYLPNSRCGSWNMTTGAVTEKYYVWSIHRFGTALPYGATHVPLSEACNRFRNTTSLGCTNHHSTLCSALYVVLLCEITFTPKVQQWYSLLTWTDLVQLWNIHECPTLQYGACSWVQYAILYKKTFNLLPSCSYTRTKYWVKWWKSSLSRCNGHYFSSKKWKLWHGMFS